jgi:hypothetical protein
MRIFVSLVPFLVSHDELLSRFESLGGDVQLSVPVARILGGERIPRHFLHVRIRGVEESKIKSFVRAVRSSIGSTCATSRKKKRCLC